MFYKIIGRKFNKVKKGGRRQYSQSLLNSPPFLAFLHLPAPGRPGLRYIRARARARNARERLGLDKAFKKLEN